MSFETFKVEYLRQGTIAKVTLSRPKALNAMNPKFFEEVGTIFNSFNSKDNLRVVVIFAEGRVFSAGLDLKQYGSMFSTDLQGQDVARFSKTLYESVVQMQKPFLSIFDCRVPVLVGVHGKCIGGGVDLVSMCDIRYCSSDAEFSIKQIDIGMAADLGTLQIMSNASGSQSTFRQMAYTARFLKAEQAKQIGFVTRVVGTREQLQKQVMRNAELIASKSPVGIYTIKLVTKRQFRRRIEESLEYSARMNSSMLMTKDTVEAISAFLQKRQPVFPKL